MIVSEVMTTNVITVTPDDLLSHAANVMRQHQFHHLPVVRGKAGQNAWITNLQEKKTPLVLEGFLTAQDIDLAIAIENSHAGEQRSWEEILVRDVMLHDPLCITPTTSVVAAARLLVERGLNYLPVVEYSEPEGASEQAERQQKTYLVGLLTRSDLLLALARGLGAYEPGMELLIPLPAGNFLPLATMLQMAAELHIGVQSLIVVPAQGKTPRVATVRIGTINPTPLFARLRKEGIAYGFASFQPEGEINAR